MNKQGRFTFRVTASLLPVSKKYRMKKISLTLLLLLTIPFAGRTQSLYFPPLGNTNQWDSLSLNTLGWCPDKLDSLLDYLGQRNTKAFLLLKDGKIVVEKYYGTFTMDSVWYWASAGKTLTSFAVGLAQQDGFLTIQDKTSDYLGTGWTIAPSLKENLISIRHQLTMSSGLDDGVPDPHCTLDTCLQYLADAGTRWAYHNGPYTLLDSVVESATGQTLNNYFTQKVKTPTGMTGVFVPSGFNNVFVSKPRSMARFGLLMLNKGRWGNTPIMTDTNYFQAMVNTSQPLNPSYGYLWWLNGKSGYRLPGLQVLFNGPLCPAAPADMVAALGKNGQFLNVVPSLNLVWLRMGDVPNAGEVPVTLNDTIWQKLNLVMCAPAGLSQQANKEALHMYPNPASTHLYLTENLNAFTLYDLCGRRLMQIDHPQAGQAYSVQELPTGLYTVIFRDIQGHTGQQRLLIVR